MKSQKQNQERMNDHSPQPDVKDLPVTGGEGKKTSDKGVVANLRLEHGTSSLTSLADTKTELERINQEIERSKELERIVIGDALKIQKRTTERLLDKKETLKKVSLMWADEMLDEIGKFYCQCGCCEEVIEYNPRIETLIKQLQGIKSLMEKA